MNMEAKRPINRYKQMIKAKMMLKKRRGKKNQKNAKTVSLDASMNAEKLNPSEMQKAKLISRLNSFRGSSDASKFKGELAIFLECNNKVLLSKIVDEMERADLLELVEEAIDQFCFGTANRKNAKNRSLSGIFLDFAKTQIEEDDPMKVKTIFQKSVAHQKSISKDKERSKVKSSQAHITSNPNFKARNMFDDLSDENDSDDSEESEDDKQKTVAMKVTLECHNDDDFESVDEDEVMNG